MSRRIAPFALALALCWVPSCSPKQEEAGKKGTASPSTTPKESAANRHIRENGPECVYLLDTGTPSDAPISGDAVKTKTGWEVVPEETLDHAFKGDIVFLNNKIAVVLRKRGQGAEVYGLAGSGPVLRTTIMPEGADGDRATALGSVEVEENHAGTALVRATYTTGKGRNAELTLNLTAADMVLKIVGGAGAAAIFERTPSPRLLIPDFFADDLVYGGEEFGVPRVWLPAENFFLHLIAGGDAMVMCVRQSLKQDAEMVISTDGDGRRIAGASVRCTKGETIWFAFMEIPGAWWEKPCESVPAEGRITLDWKPALAAKWRANLVGGGGVTRSVNFGDEPESCCVIMDDRAEIDASAVVGARFMLIYPLDRTRETPLATYLPIDIMRNTLGTGPCEDQLKREGFAGASSPTPHEAMKFARNAFRAGQDKANEAEMKKRFDDMIAYVKYMDGRIDRYAAFAGDVAAACAKSEAAGLSAAKAIQDIAAEVATAVAAYKQGTPTRAAEELAAKVTALVGKADAATVCLPLGEQIDALGNLQDYTLAKCRMAARRIKQQCLIAAQQEAEAAAFAATVLGLTEQVLQSGESPRQ